MPVDSLHPEYKKYLSIWTKCRDAIEGEEAVKRAGEVYLPRLEGQDHSDYLNYLTRATFYGAAGRTTSGLAGAVLHKQPDIDWPREEEDALKTLGRYGESLSVLLQNALEEAIGVGRVGLYVDGEPESNEPYVAIFYAENIINWQSAIVGDREVPTLIVLEEQAKVGGDIYEPEIETRWRVLFLNRAGEEPVYEVRVFRMVESDDGKGGKTKTFVQIEYTVPTAKGGGTFDRIPFVLIGPEGVSTRVQKPPLLDLVNVNLAHFRNSADLEHGLHFTALPTAWVAGVEEDKHAYRIGSATAWIFEKPEARAGYLEFQGAGLEAIATEMVEKKRLMAVLGARLLEEQKREAESSETVKMRHAGEKSVLSNISESVSEGMSLVLQWVGRWRGQRDYKKRSMTLNQDFDFLQMDPNMLTALVAAWQGGAMSRQVLRHNLRRGELFPDGWTDEDEESALETEGPARLVPATGGGPQIEGTNDKNVAQQGGDVTD